MVATLIVDDNAGFRATLRQVLTARFSFLHVVEAASVRDALARAGTFDPDIFFVEMRLPDGSGLDLARLLARGYRSAAIGIVTSFDIPEYRSAAKAAGASHFIAKGSSTSAEVIAVVDSFLHGRTRTLLIFDSPKPCQVARDAISGRWPEMVVVEATDELDGFAKAIALHPNFALVSASLLRSRGPSLCAALKAANPFTVVIAMRSVLSAVGRESAQPIGADYAIDWGGDLGDSLAALLDPHASSSHDHRSSGPTAAHPSRAATPMAPSRPNVRLLPAGAGKKPEL